MKSHIIKLIPILTLLATASLPRSAGAQSAITETNATGGANTISNPQSSNPQFSNSESFFGTVGSYFTSSNPNLPIKGTAEIDNADVRGVFEGNLIVRKRLLIRAGGQVSGTIRYGQLEIELGGQICGDVQSNAEAGDIIAELPNARAAS